MPRQLKIGLVLLVVALLLDGAYVGVRLGLSLYHAQKELVAAGNSFADGDVASAEAHFIAAGDASKQASGDTDHPAFLIATVLPWIRRDAHALNALADAAGTASQAGLQGVAAARAVGAGDKGLAASLYQGGKVDLENVRTSLPFVRKIADLSSSAVAELDGQARPLLSFVRLELEKARTRFHDLSDLSNKGSALMAALPKLLGEKHTVRYLLTFQSPSEARATGGLSGLFGILTAKDGRLSLGKVLKPPSPLIAASLPIGPVAAPQWFKDTYGIEGALQNSSEANSSPNFPVVGEVWLRLWQAAQHQKLDGVISMDPIALGDAMRGMSSIKVEGLPAVSSSNAREVLLHTSYTQLTRKQQDKALAKLIGKFWDQLDSGSLNSSEFIKGLAEAVSTEHLKVFSRDSAAQALLDDAGAAGDYTSYGPNVQIVWHNSRSISKVDYYMHRTLQTVIELQDDGSAHVKTTALLDNRAPDGPPSDFLGGRDPGYSAGENKMDLNVLLPQGSKVQKVTEYGDPVPIRRAREGRYPMVQQKFDILAGKQALTSVDYTIGAGPDPETFTFTMFPQPGVNPDVYTILVRAPAGKLVGIRGSDDPPADSVELEGTLDRPTNMTIDVTNG